MPRATLGRILTATLVCCAVMIHVGCQRSPLEPDVSGEMAAHERSHSTRVVLADSTRSEGRVSHFGEGTRSTYIYGVYEAYTVDDDGDSYYEEWYFEIDVDVPGNYTDQTSIHIQDDEGNDYGWFGPYSFYNGSTSDNVFIGPFTDCLVDPDNPPENVTFTFTLSNGGDTDTEVTPVDDCAQAPYIYGVYEAYTVDDDGDSYYEEWYFEIDVDVPGNYTDQTSIHIQDDEGNNYGWFGPYSFYNGSTSDNVFIGPFTDCLVDPDNPPENVTFTFTLSNGGDTDTEVTPVDDCAQAPYIYGVYEAYTVDDDGDSYYEEWYFEIDVDVPGNYTDQTSIHIQDDEGNDYGWFGPYSFYNGSTSDNVFIGPFTDCLVDPDNPPENVTFTFTLSNGGDTDTEVTPVDDCAQAPYIYGVYEAYTVDDDGDSYYEEWYFEIDVDVPGNYTDQTSIHIQDDEGNDYGWFGPYSFYNGSTSDNVFIGPFTDCLVDPDNPPENVTFTFTLSNGGDTDTEVTPVDDCAQAPYIYGVYEAYTVDDDGDSYYEEWYFEIDVDVPGNYTDQTSIHIQDDEGNNYGWFGPYSFYNGSTSDNVFIGPFTDCLVDPDNPPENVTFTFTLSNGGDTDTEVTPVDDCAQAPYIYGVYEAYTVDDDGDSYYEEWYFEIDVDVPGNYTDQTSIHIQDDEGNNYGWFGPYSFYNGSTSDNVFIGPFTDCLVDPDNPPENVTFTFTLSNGGDTDTEVTPVDDCAQAPYIYGVYEAYTVDDDGDSYYEEWYFEIDVDVPGNYTDQTSIHIQDDEGNDYGWFGPYSFYNGSTSDNVFIGPFTDCLVDPDNPPENVTFTFTLSNGGDTDTEVTPVDDCAQAPYIYGVYEAYTVDDDGDSYYEEWYFEIDVDVPGNYTDQTSIHIQDDEGNDYGWFGPYSFYNGSTSDNVFIGPFTDCLVDPDNPPENVTFTFTLSNGGDTDTEVTPVDDCAQAPYIYDVDEALIVDEDGASGVPNGYYEEWYFEIDVDVPGNYTDQTSIHIQDDEGNDYGWFGPYSFYNGSTSDNVFIGPFTDDLVDPDAPPEDVVFTFTLSNGGDVATEITPVENWTVPVESPTVASVYPVEFEDADDNLFYEVWSFEVDVDVPGSGAYTTHIFLADDMGHEYGPFGPFAFSGSGVHDRVVIGPFTPCSTVAEGNPREVGFSVSIEWSTDTEDSWIPVDRCEQ